MAKDKPNYPGYYWAATRNCKWWNLIAEISGNAPFLKVDIYSLGYFPRSYGGPPCELDIDKWGPKIEKPPEKPNA